MTDTGWPDEAREAVESALETVLSNSGVDFWREAEVVQDLVPAALAALAPFFTARIADAEARGRIAGLREAAKIARNACLVPPDGGAPTEAEADVCDRAADAILARVEAQP